MLPRHLVLTRCIRLFKCNSQIISFNLLSPLRSTILQLAALINSFVPAASRRALCALPVSGTSSMLDHVRRSHLQQFRDGACSILVSTNALEEGIDVADCSFIVRFDFVGTTKSHIQGAGRARAPNARVFYFKNDAVEEVRRAALLEEVARNSSLALNADELQRAQTLLSSPPPLADCVYPFRVSLSLPPSSSTALLDSKVAGEVNFFNCSQILNEVRALAFHRPHADAWPAAISAFSMRGRIRLCVPRSDSHI